MNLLDLQTEVVLGLLGFILVNLFVTLLAKDFSEQITPLHILVNRAGIDSER